jgi:hypothetical protein
MGKEIEYSHANESKEIDAKKEKIFHRRIQSVYLSSSQLMSFQNQILGAIIDSEDRQSSVDF